MTSNILSIPPKTETSTHEGQRYTLTYHPGEPEGHRWGWYVAFRATYDFYGNATSLEAARRAACRQIDRLKKDEW